MDAYTLVNAVKLADKFERFAKRRLSGDDQDYDASRTIARTDAAWLAAMILGGQSEGFPHVVIWTGDLPSDEQFAAMPVLAAQTILFGLGIDETMRRCHERAYSRTPGPKHKPQTLDDVKARHVGNALDGGDPRYEQRLRKRAREDEVASGLAIEWEEAMRALDARSKRQA